MYAQQEKGARERDYYSILQGEPGDQGMKGEPGMNGTDGDPVS